MSKPLVNRKVPDFEAVAIMADGAIDESFRLSDYEDR